MIGLFVILIIMGSVFLIACTCIVGGMIWTGRVAVPGSEAHRLHRARTNQEIALSEASRANFLLQKAQADAQRQVIEAKTVDELQNLWDEKMLRELGPAPDQYE